MSASASTIQAVVYRKKGDAAQIESVARPVLTDANDLLVEIRAVATNPVDHKLPYMKPTEAPQTTGYDAAGVVVQVGTSAAAQQFKVGDEVYYSGALFRNGSFAEFQLVDSRLVALKPKSLPFLEAAAFPLVSITAWETFHEIMRVQAGKTIFILGGAGGVGSVAIQLAKQAGLKVIASASRDETRDWVKKLGADLVIDHTKGLEDEFKAQNIAPVDYIFNTVSEKHLPSFLPIIAPLGHIVGINGDGEVSSDLLRAFFMKRVQISFELMFVRSLYGIEPEKQGALLAEVAKLIDAGKVKPINSTAVAYTGFTGVEEATKVQLSGKAIGKLVIQIKA